MRSSLDIYRPYVLESTITMEIIVPDLETFRTRVDGIAAHYPYLVLEEEGRICGYACSSRHNPRDGYLYNAAVSIYLRPDCQGKGIGGRLYSRLFAALRVQGVFNVYAGITLGNPASFRLHAAYGFTPIGTFSRAGYKFGRWHNVIWLEKHLRTDAVPPPSLLSPEEAFALSAEAGE